VTVRREKRIDRTTGATREFWRIDVVFEHADGRIERVRKVFHGPRRDAEAFERQMRSELIHPRVRREVPTFKDFIDETWWPTYPVAAGNSHTTVREKCSHLKLHLQPFFGGTPLDAINLALLSRFVAAMARKTKGKVGKKTLSAKRVKNVMATLRKILVSAHEWEVIDKLPRFPKIKTHERDVDFFTRDESALVLDAARDPEERAILMFAFHTGARAGEQLAFEWGDLDLRNRFVCLRRSSSNGTVRDTTKSGKPRKVPLTASLESALKAIRHAKGPLVFCRGDGLALVAVDAPRASLGRMPARRSSPHPLARLPALVRVAAGHRRHTPASGAGVAGPQHHHDDDALCAPRSRRRPRVPRGARGAEPRPPDGHARRCRAQGRVIADE
jgi:integrase